MCVIKHAKSHQKLLRFSIGVCCSSLRDEQKQSCRSVLTKRCSENMQQIYRRTPMPKCDFRHWCSPVNLPHIFRMPFLKNTSEGLLLDKVKLRMVQNQWLVFSHMNKCLIFEALLCLSWKEFYRKEPRV